VDTWTLVLPEEDDRESVLKKAIAEGLESGIAESFDPKHHLKSLKGQS
jgi:antitoxin ParD1/3/4